jgi:hypothetical protein
MAIIDFYFKAATTDLSPRSQIVELAAVDRYNNSSFVRVINPSVPITQGATQVHRISKEEDGLLYSNGKIINGVVSLGTVIV